MRHVVFGALLALYVVVISQNWGAYTAALLLALWVRYDGRLDAVPFTVDLLRSADDQTERG